MKNEKQNLDEVITDDAVIIDEKTIVDAPSAETGNLTCQVRRKIEDYLEKKRYKDEFGFDEELELR